MPLWYSPVNTMTPSTRSASWLSTLPYSVLLANAAGEAGLPDAPPGDTKTATPTVRMTVVDSSHQVERTERNFVHSERSTPVMVRFPATGLARPGDGGGSRH